MTLLKVKEIKNVAAFFYYIEKRRTLISLPRRLIKLIIKQSNELLINMNHEIIIRFMKPVVLVGHVQMRNTSL